MQDDGMWLDDSDAGRGRRGQSAEQLEAALLNVFRLLETEIEKKTVVVVVVERGWGLDAAAPGDREIEKKTVGWWKDVRRRLD
ncbi:hypothetical protein PIB30_103578, partial [Stylosanthes scabra]|nr:hypothetical protein [Stylosanthes scabra]